MSTDKKYLAYLSQAKIEEDKNDFFNAIVLYKKALQLSPLEVDNFVLSKINQIERDHDFSKCICSENSFCDRYKTHNNGQLINYSWCQSACEEDRKILFKLQNKNCNLPLKEKRQNPNKHYLPYQAFDNQVGKCILATIHQTKKNKVLEELYEQYKDDKVDTSKVQILSLGHAHKQFSSVRDKRYIKKVNLNEIDAGEYSGNEWSESRAYISKIPLIRDDADFVGFTSASWNFKYTDNPIDNFHNWNSTKILLNAPIEKKIVLCAHVHCSCLWEHKNSFFNTIYSKNQEIKIAKTFQRMIGFDHKKHIYVPYSNQMIAHKSIIKDYIKFLHDQDVFSKANWLVNKLGSDNFVDEYKKCNYHNVRLNGYFMEMAFCYWLNMQDYLYIPNHISGLYDWYDRNYLKERCEKWL